MKLARRTIISRAENGYCFVLFKVVTVIIGFILLVVKILYLIDWVAVLQLLFKVVTVIIGFILLVVKILYLIDWVAVLQLTGIEG